jgi:hypothetical protein
MDSTETDGHIPWFLRLFVAKQDYEAGDPLAIDECVLACHEGREPIPEWAMPALAERSKIRLGIISDPAKRGGPHANPHRAREDRMRQFAAFCAMLAAQKSGYKGDRKLDIVRYLLRQNDIKYECETIEKIYKDLKKKLNISDHVNSWPVEQYEMAIEAISEGKDPEDFWD